MSNLQGVFAFGCLIGCRCLRIGCVFLDIQVPNQTHFSKGPTIFPSGPLIKTNVCSC